MASKESGASNHFTNEVNNKSQLQIGRLPFWNSVCIWFQQELKHLKVFNSQKLLAIVFMCDIANSVNYPLSPFSVTEILNCKKKQCSCINITVGTATNMNGLTNKREYIFSCFRAIVFTRFTNFPNLTPISWDNQYQKWGLKFLKSFKLRKCKLRFEMVNFYTIIHYGSTYSQL